MTLRCSFAPVVLLGLSGLVAPVVATAWGLDCAHSAERRTTADTAGVSRVVILARAGDLHVQPATDTTLVAQGKACASSAVALAQTSVRTIREGSVLRVEVLAPDQHFGFGTFYATLDLTVDVPASVPVEITDSSGDIEARDLRIAKVTDSSGDIRLRNAQSDVEIFDSSGDIQVQEATGRVQVDDSSGDIVILGAASVLIQRDSSGDISIQRIAGDVRIEQDSSGEVRVSDVDGGFALLADSSGDVKVAHVRGEVTLP